MNDPNATITPTETPAEATPAAPTIESVTAENESLKRQLGLAQQQIQQVHAMATAFETTARTLAQWCPPPGLAQR